MSRGSLFPFKYHRRQKIRPAKHFRMAFRNNLGLISINASLYRRRRKCFIGQKTFWNCSKKQPRTDNDVNKCLLILLVYIPPEAIFLKIKPIKPFGIVSRSSSWLLSLTFQYFGILFIWVDSNDETWLMY